MIDSLISYIRKDVFPRYHRILFTSHPWLAASVALGAAKGYFPISEDLKYFAISSSLLTYNTVVIGFCVSAVAICFTFSKRFSSILCKIKDHDSGFSSYQDLVFVFSWTAMVHMCASVVIIYLYFSHGDFSLSAEVDGGFSFVVLILLMVEIYCFLQFFVTIITVHQVANVYAKMSER